MSRTRKGVVYIAPVDQVPADGSMVSPESRFPASWQSNEEGLLEHGPECANAEEAIAWGRARAATVVDPARPLSSPARIRARPAAGRRRGAGRVLPLPRTRAPDSAR